MADRFNQYERELLGAFRARYKRLAGVTLDPTVPGEVIVRLPVAGPWVLQPRWDRHPMINGGLPREIRRRRDLEALLATCTRRGCIPDLTLHGGTCPLASYVSRAPRRRRYRVLVDKAVR